ncbi:MAG: HpcH/HpaI aldolase family protein [Lawsonibacter sp.]|jgi:2-keto-3-deoxy-L-rhamnonate aldolase RhmA
MYFSTHEASSAFQKKLHSGELVVGTWINAIKDPILAKILGACGLDYVLIDGEHSGATPATLSETCVLARECGVYPMVRPADPNDLKGNGRLMDAGAMGLVVPHIDSVDQARRVANSIRYFNGGTRGFGSRSLGSGFQKMTEEAMIQADREVTCVVQFESVAAVEQADEIMAIDGVDVAIIGRGDLAMDMGLPGRGTDDRVTVLVEKVYEAARRNGKVPGLLTDSLEGAIKWMGRGVKFLTYGSEVGWLMSAYENGLKAIHQAQQEMEQESTK